MEPIQVLNNIYQSNNYRKNLSWPHFNDEPRAQEKKQMKHQQSWIFAFLFDLYNDIAIEPHNIPETLVSNESVIQPDTSSETSMDLEVDENSLDKYRIASNETSLISNLFDISEV